MIDDIAELGALLEGTRLITLTGPGGIGKTSLAIELARATASAVPDGAWFVALDTVADADQVGSVIARTLGLFDGFERPAAEALPGFMAARSMLLVLDNFEQVIDAAGLVASLLRASPGSRFVVTSRAPLHVGGEQEYPVRSLPTGTADPSVALFVERGRASASRLGPGPDAPVDRRDLRAPRRPPARDRTRGGAPVDPARRAPSAIVSRHICRCRARDHATRRRGNRRSTARSPGATTCSHPTSDSSSTMSAVFDGGFDLAQAERVVATDGVPDASLVLDRLVALAEQSLIARAASDRR